MDDLLEEFIAEVQEDLLKIEQDLLDFEDNPEKDEALDRIFRTVHTIKGTCGFLELPNLETLAHAIEAVLSRLRAKELSISKEVVDLILSGVDAVKDTINTLAQTGQEPHKQNQELLTALSAIREQPAMREQPVSPTEPENLEADLAAAMAQALGDASLSEAVLQESAVQESAVQDAAKQAAAATASEGPAHEEEPAVASPAASKDASSDLPPSAAATPAAATPDTPPSGADDSEADASTFEDIVSRSDERQARTNNALQRLKTTPEWADELSSEQLDEALGNVGRILRDSFDKWYNENIDETGVQETDEPAVSDSKTAPVADAPASSVPAVPVPQSATSADSQQGSATTDATQVATTEATQPTQDTPKNSQAARTGKKPADEPAKSVRINVDILESLMDSVSELVLARNQLGQLAQTNPQPGYTPVLQQINLITSELQEGITRSRMQSVSAIWNPIPRLVRELSAELGKKIDLVRRGSETGLDRQLLEALRNPLIHLIRNAIDHGIETPDERIQKNKVPQGTISLNAYQEGGHFVMEVRDDGKGIHTQELLQIALRKNLISHEEADLMSSEQIMRLLFLPGFSTSSNVTALSGRGVGMDVVKSEIDAIGGMVDIHSQHNVGTTISMRIPLTLSIVSALIVGARGMRLVLPQLSAVEIVHTHPRPESYITKIEEAPVLMLRNQIIPLLSLGDLIETGITANKGTATAQQHARQAIHSPLGQKSRYFAKSLASIAPELLVGIDSFTSPDPEGTTAGALDPEALTARALEQQKAMGKKTFTPFQEKLLRRRKIFMRDRDNFVVVIKAGVATYGLLVDQIYDNLEIVVKPLSSLLNHIPFFSGTTILGDGSVVMILDPTGLANQLGQAKPSSQAILEDEFLSETGSEIPRLTMLVVRTFDGATKALPLSLVARLEEVDSSKVEYTNGRPVLQHQTGLIRLINIDGSFQLPDLERIRMLIVTNGRKGVGLIVAHIDDIVSEIDEIQLEDNSERIVGSVLIDGKVTEVLEAAYYWRRAVSSEVEPSAVSL